MKIPYSLLLISTLSLPVVVFAQAPSTKVVPSLQQVDEYGGHGGRLIQTEASPLNSPRTALSTRTLLTTTESCSNLLPNPSFNDQNVSPLSGNRFNVKSVLANSDELSGWHSTNGSTPDYYATNAPIGSQSNPNTAGAAYGSFPPYNNVVGGHNGAVGLYILTSTPDEEYITPNTPIALSAGSYYAAFRAYRSNGGVGGGTPDATKLGMDFSTVDKTTTNYNATFSRSASSIESPNYLTNSAWTLVSGVVNLSAANYYVNIGNLSPTAHAGTGILAYYFIDDLALYKIPTAGPAITTPCATEVTIGEGCAIPNATYAWSINGGTPFAHSLQTTVKPVFTTIYTLTITLPDGSTSATNVTVTVATSTASIPAPQIMFVNQVDCQHQARFRITNFNPAFSYTVNNVSNAVPLPANLTTYEFRVKGATASNNPGIFTVTVTGCGNSTTSGQQTADYQCSQNQLTATVNATTAYPNPANEALTIPKGVQEVMLRNNMGSVVRQSGSDSKVDVQNLPAGLYILQMLRDGKTINQRIQVNH